MSIKTTSFLFRLFSVLILLIMLFSTQESTYTVSAGTGVWTSNGPEGGRINALTIDPAMPTTIYAGTEGGGVFKSTNGGVSWNSVNTNLTGPRVRALAIDAMAPTTLYAGTWNDGVFKSTNGGGNWSAVNTGLTNTNIRALVTNPVTPNTLYAGTRGGGVFKSTNGGGNWSAINNSLPDSFIETLAIDPLTPNTIYIGIDGDVYKSTNGGDNWSIINTGLPTPNPVVCTVAALAVDPSTPDTLYAGTMGCGVYKSMNGGGNWSAANTGLAGMIHSLAIDPATPTTLYAGTDYGVYKSTNGGINWNAVSNGLHDIKIITAFAIDMATPTTLYAGTGYNGDLFKSTNGGGNWITVNSGLTATIVQSLAIDPMTPAIIYAGVERSGIYKSTNGGGNWTTVNTDLSTNAYFEVLAIDPVTPSTIYAGTSEGVFKSMNSGGNWSSINNGLSTESPAWVRALAIDPSTPNTLYAGTWGDGVFKSTNGGENWSAVNTDLPAYTIVWSLVIDPATPTILYAGTRGGIYKSTNGGGNWSPVNNGLPATDFPTLVIDSMTPATLYAGTWNDGVFKSTNGGGDWNPVNTGLTNTNIRALAIDMSLPDTIYAGTEGGGVFKSTNGGGNWSALSAGLPAINIQALVIDPVTPSVLYAGTDGGGVASFNSSSTLCGSGTWTYGHLEIHHINIGQGDSTLIVGPTGKSLLFDAGESYWNSSIDAQTIGSYIETVLGCKELNYVVVSHFHVDHVGYVGYGGLYHLVETQGFTVGSTLVRDYNTYLGDISSTFTNWKAYLEGAGQAKLHPVTAIEGTSQVDLGTGVTFDIVAVDGNGAIIPGDFSGDASPPSENDYSIGAVLSFGNFDEWIGGDLDGQYEIGGFGYTYHDIELSVAPEVGDVDVYKANHHASSHSSSATFINQIDPEVSIVTVGDGNTYGHPIQSIMDRLLATSTVYMTERGNLNTNVGSAIVAGNIVIKTSNGSSYTVDGTTYTASEPIRTDTDGDGYFAEADPNDNAYGITPAPNGGCSPIYQTCSVACQVTSGQVLVNEVLPSPSSGLEWVELYNTTNSTINLGYCYIDDIVAGSAAYQIPAGALIPAYGFWTLDRTNYFNNAGDDVRFLKEDGSTVLDSYTFGNTGSDLSRYRLPDGGSWAISPTALTTKGLSNNTPFHPIVLASTRANPSPTSAAIVNFTVTFSKSVTGVNIAPLSDFTLTTTGVTGAAITGLSGSGTTYTVTVNTGSGNGTVRLDVVDDDSIKDVANNPLGGVNAGNGNYASGEVYDIIKNPVTITGNAGVAGATLNYTYGTPKTATADGSGNYTISVPLGWSGTVTPYKSGYTFTPVSTPYSNVQSNQTSQNYTATSCISCADVNVTIGGSLTGAYTLAAGGRVSPRYGINGGPVHVFSTNGKPIFTSQRAVFGNSFNSIVGYPGNQLTTEYWFTSLDDLGMITYLVIGNPSTTLTAHVDVYIAGNKMNTTPYTIAPGQRVFPRYGINGGPVRVVSDIPIFTSERTKYGNSFNEVLGYPANQLTTEYWFTSLDNLGMITYLVIGNPSTVDTALVDVYIAGNKMNTTPYSIAPGQRVFPRYGINGGPVQVVSTNGVPIFTSERTKYGNSFNEVLGYPGNKLALEYWFTSLDDASMITYLVIGNPSTTLTAHVDVYINGVKVNTTPYAIAPGQRVFPRYGVNSGTVRVVSDIPIFTSERTKYLSSFNEILGIPTNQLTTEYWFTSLDDLGMVTELVIAAP